MDGEVDTRTLVEVFPGDAPSDVELVPAFAERTAQRQALTDRETLDEILLRLDRIDAAVTAASSLVPVLTEAVKREGLVGLIRAIPELMSLGARMRSSDQPQTGEPDV